MKARSKLISFLAMFVDILNLVSPVLTGSIARADGIRLEKLLTLGHETARIGVQWSPGGGRLATFSGTNDPIIVWNSDGTHERDLVPRAKDIDLGRGVGFLSSGKSLVSPATSRASDDLVTIGGITYSTVRFHVWDIDTGVLLYEGPAPGQHVMNSISARFSLSPDGQHAAFSTGTSGEPITLYRTSDWSIEREIPINGEFEFSPDNSVLAIATSCGRVFLIDLNEVETKPKTLNTNDAGSCSSSTRFAISPDGQYLATASLNYPVEPNTANSPKHVLEKAMIKIWRLSDGKLVNLLPSLFFSVVSLSWSSDGGLLAAAGQTDDRALAEALKSDNPIVAAFAHIGTAAIYSPGDPLAAPLVETFKAIPSASFSPDGQKLAVTAGKEVIIFAVRR